MQDRASLAIRLEDLRKHVQEYAKAEEAYRSALASKITEHKASGESVTLISDLARGEVSKLKMQRDIAYGMRRASELSVGSIQSSLSGIQSLLSIERSKIENRIYHEGS